MAPRALVKDVKVKHSGKLAERLPTIPCKWCVRPHRPRARETNWSRYSVKRHMALCRHQVLTALKTSVAWQFRRLAI